MPMWKSIVSTVAVGIVMSTVGGCANPGAWEEGKQYGQWRLAFHGNGSVTGSDKEVTMQPKSAESADKTHACLVYTDKKFADRVDFEITVRTEQQVRSGQPNPWEVGWVLWNYENNDRFYALTLKPNGWELSKQDPAYRGHQRFLASGHEPQFPINQDHRVHIIQEGNNVTFFANGTELGHFTDDERPYQGGSIALYTEDAKVTFSDLKVAN